MLIDVLMQTQAGRTAVALHLLAFKFNAKGSELWTLTLSGCIRWATMHESNPIVVSGYHREVVSRARKGCTSRRQNLSASLPTACRGVGRRL